MRFRFLLFVVLLLMWNGLPFAPREISAQTPSAPEQKRKRKDFGSSLKKLKWDPEKNAAVEDNRSKGATQETTDDEVIRVEVPLVTCDFLVLNNQGHGVAGLTQNDFIITEDSEPQPIATFALGDDMRRPRSIILIIDYSGSQLPYIKTSVEAAKTLVDKLGPLDKMAIVTDDVALLVDFTQDKGKLKRSLESLLPNPLGAKFGRSKQYSALMATLRELVPEEERPIIIFQTDGDQLHALRGSDALTMLGPSQNFQDLPPEQQKRLLALRERLMLEFSLADLMKTAEKSRATIYSVVPGIRMIGFSPAEQIERIRAILERFHMPSSRQEIKVDLQKSAEIILRMQQALMDVAQITGGWADFLEDPSQAAAVYSRILSDINRRYIIGYQPINKARDGTLRKIKIEVRGHPEYTVWGRQSYYAPEQ